MTDFEKLVRANFRFGRMCCSRKTIDSLRCTDYNK